MVFASVGDCAGAKVGRQVAVGAMGNRADVALKKAFTAVEDAEEI